MFPLNLNHKQPMKQEIYIQKARITPPAGRINRSYGLSPSKYYFNIKIIGYRQSASRKICLENILLHHPLGVKKRTIQSDTV
jgi:hypothetical protein